MKQFFSLILLGTTTVLWPVGKALASQTPQAQIAIQSRSASNDSMEFASQAQALGLETLAEALGRRGVASSETVAEMESRLVRAQEEWIHFQSTPLTNFSTTAIERFLALEFETTWDEESRMAYYEFHQRLARMRPERRETHLRLSTIFLAHLRLAARNQEVATPIEMAEAESRLAVRWVSFSEVPMEMAGLFVDGHWYDRTQGRFPLIYDKAATEGVRLVGVSNSHLPITVTVSPTAKNLELASRLKPSQPLTADVPSCFATAPFSSRLGRLVVIDNVDCRTSILQGNLRDETVPAPLHLGKKFGLQQIDSDPFRDQKPLKPVAQIKPWVWAALGGVALTALLISNNRNRQQDSAAVQPVHRTGW